MASSPTLVDIHTLQPRDMATVITKKSSILNRLPKSVRERIFAPFLILMTWCNFYPDLIIALRQEPHLYREALAILYKMNTFNLDAYTIKGFYKSSRLVLSAIRTLHVEIDKSKIHRPEHNPTESWLQRAVFFCSGLEEVVVHCKSHLFSSRGLWSDFVRYFPAWLVAFRVARKLTLILPGDEILSSKHTSTLPMFVRDRIVGSNISDLNKILGVNGQLVEQVRLDEEKAQLDGWKDWEDIIDHDTWVWEAEEGKRLDFSLILGLEKWASHLGFHADKVEEQFGDEALDDHASEKKIPEEEGDETENEQDGGVSLHQKCQDAIDVMFVNFNNENIEFMDLGDEDDEYDDEDEDGTDEEYQSYL